MEIAAYIIASIAAIVISLAAYVRHDHTDDDYTGWEEW